MKARITHTISYLGIRLILFVGVLFLFFLAYFFYHSSVTISGYETINPFYTYSEQLKWWLHIIIYFALFSFLSSIAFIALSFYFIKRRDYVENIEKGYELQISKMLIEYIYSDLINKPQNNKKDYIGFFKEIVNNKLAREVFFTLIIRFQVLISDKISLKLKVLIEKTGLENSFETFLYSYNKSEQIIAVKIISFLKLDKHKQAIAKHIASFNKKLKYSSVIKIEAYEKAILKYMNSRNLTLRNEATMALIRLSNADNLYELLSKRKQISRLGINSIVNTIENINNNNIEIEKLINSSNPRVAAIGVLLAQSYNKIEYKNNIKDLLDSNDHLLCEISWEVYAGFVSTDDDAHFMMEKYKNETHQNKFTIVNALHKFEFNDSLSEFLDHIIANEDIEMKVIAMQILFAEDFMLLLSYKNSSDKKIVDSYKEVTDLIIV